MDGDPERAHRWYERAAQDGNAEATERLKILASLSGTDPSD
jgi:TPR repeat protein